MKFIDCHGTEREMDDPGRTPYVIPVALDCGASFGAEYRLDREAGCYREYGRAYLPNYHDPIALVAKLTYCATCRRCSFHCECGEAVE